MEFKAIGRYIKGSPQKARLVGDLIRGRKAGEALSILRFTKKRAAAAISKVLQSAISNAQQKEARIDVDELIVSRIQIDQGPTKHRRRMRPAPMGRAFREVRRSKHITIYLQDRSESKE